MTHEYRVVWRREHDGRQRTRLYQTNEGAKDFARFLKHPWETAEGSILGDNLKRLGVPTDVRIQRRPVGDWQEGPA